MKPLNDYIFVREVRQTLSPGGIVLPVAERPWEAEGLDQKEGIVVAVGPGVKKRAGRRESMWGIEPGQKLAFSPNGNMKQVVDGEELTVIRRDSVFGEAA